VILPDGGCYAVCVRLLTDRGSPPGKYLTIHYMNGAVISGTSWKQRYVLEDSGFRYHILVARYLSKMPSFSDLICHWGFSQPTCKSHRLKRGHWQSEERKPPNDSLQEAWVVVGCVKECGNRFTYSP
jgi:hypothetical protein